MCFIYHLLFLSKSIVKFLVYFTIFFTILLFLLFYEKHKKQNVVENLCYSNNKNNVTKIAIQKNEKEKKTKKFQKNKK